MMEVLFFYSIFALATGFSALYEVFWPVIKQVRTSNPDTMVARNWKMTTFSLVVGAVLIAPLMIWSILVPSFSTKFRNSLYINLITEQKS